MKKVLITCGPTWVPVDDVRVLSNRSTGALGQRIAQDLDKAGVKVTLLEGPVTRPLQSKTIKVLKFLFYNELSDLLKGELKRKFDIIIHAAAVSDYQLKKTFRTKLKSGAKEITLTLIPTEKIINEIKRLSPGSFLVGFKLETSSVRNVLVKGAAYLIRNARCDLVVANSLKNDRYSGYIIDQDGKISAHAASRADMSRRLIEILRDQL